MMRKFLLIFIIFLKTFLISAQEQASSLQIRMWDNSLFSVIFAGDESGRYQRTYNVRSLAGGEYYLKIMKRSSYGIENLFEGQIEIPSSARVQAVLMKDGALEISILDDIQRKSNAFDFKSKLEEIQAKIKTSPEKESSNKKIESLEFADLRNHMLRASNDTIRDSIAYEGLKKYVFTTSYIVELTKLFTEESTRLDFAKSAYTRVVDPENYFQLEFLFLKEENIKALNQYMEKKAKAGEIITNEFQGLF